MVNRVFCLLAAALLLGGCAAPVRPRELEQLRLVQVLGCDGEPGAVTVSASSAAGGDDATACLTARGRSVAEAIREMRADAPGAELFFAHVRFAVLGEDAARAGLGPVLDWFARSTQTALAVPLCVVRGGTARELTAGDGAAARLDALRLNADRLGGAHCFTLLDTARRLERGGAALSAAVTPVPAEDGALRAHPAGYAVWKDGALAGFLDPDAALGADLLLGLPCRAVMALETDDGVVTVELRGCRVRVTPAPSAGDRPAARITLDCRAGILEAEGVGRLDAGTLRTLDRALAEEVLSRVAAAVRAAQALDADALELCRRLRLDPAAFAALTWRAEVAARIERSYDVNEGGEAGHAR